MKMPDGALPLQALLHYVWTGAGLCCKSRHVCHDLPLLLLLLLLL
jgi:hypothetical protein